MRSKIFGDWELLKQKGLDHKEIARITGISRSTFYKRKKLVKLIGVSGFENKSKKPRQLRQSKIPKSTIDLICKLRQESPTYGKAKIAVLLKRDHNLNISESSTGRVLALLKTQGKIQISPSAVRAKKKRQFRNHAQRWKYGMKAKVPGELIQIDHMSVSVNNVSVKHFQAWDPVTKVIIAQVVTNATSSSAAKFLRKVKQEAPFEVKSIQVDGGSEFMQKFESTCAELDIPLYVLPPRQPQYNGGVERGNRIFREEFYADREKIPDSVGGINAYLQKAVLKYNSYRPHFCLRGMTPFDYYQNLSSAS